MRKRGRGDPEVVRPDRLAARLGLSPDLGMDARHRQADRHRLELSEQMLDESPPAHPLVPFGSMDPVEQLAHRDDADSDLLIAELFERPERWVSLRLDEQVGVD